VLTRPGFLHLLLGPALLFGAMASGGQAQTPPDSVEGCGRAGPRITQGQTGMGLGETRLRVPVPDTGTWFSLPVSSHEALMPALFICHVESASSIIIDGRTGDEVSRTVVDPGGTALLDEVAANTIVETVAMTPPRTGDGGLKGR
jgi:hypothetical protein